MATKEDEYLRQCLEQNICPVCQQTLTKKVGSGQSKDGVFCSLDCHTKWHEAELIKRHQDRIQKSKSNE
jgi:hypothetical protein